ncbi:MAG: pyridoxamine 5'-phosphate oxidase family protein [Granulosicoccus sp.]
MSDELKPAYTTDIAFTDSVKSVQQRLGSRGSMERLERSDSWPSILTDDMARWVKQRESVFIVSASLSGQPYAQHRGGPPGFIHVSDNALLIPDYSGNRHYITLGNFLENPQAFLFMWDYEAQTRVKFWGDVCVLDMESDHRQLRFEVKTWDINCKQHLPVLYAKETVSKATRKLQARIESLETELTNLKLRTDRDQA